MRARWPAMTRQSREKALRAGIASLLPLRESAGPAAIGGTPDAPFVIDQDPLARLPSLLTPAELARLLKVTPATIRRRMRRGQQATVEILGLQRITAESAAEQVRARIVRRLPGRYRMTAANACEKPDASGSTVGAGNTSQSPSRGK